jgi:hypothetical protein
LFLAKRLDFIDDLSALFLARGLRKLDVGNERLLGQVWATFVLAGILTYAGKP